MANLAWLEKYVITMAVLIYINIMYREEMACVKNMYQWKEEQTWPRS
jgi:hypothetical protein